MLSPDHLPGSEHGKVGVSIQSVRKEVKMCLPEKADRFKRAVGGRLLGKTERNLERNAERRQR